MHYFGPYGKLNYNAKNTELCEYEDGVDYEQQKKDALYKKIRVQLLAEAKQKSLKKGTQSDVNQEQILNAKQFISVDSNDVEREKVATLVKANELEHSQEQDLLSYDLEQLTQKFRKISTNEDPGQGVQGSQSNTHIYRAFKNDQLFNDSFSAYIRSG